MPMDYPQLITRTNLEWTEGDAFLVVGRGYFSEGALSAFWGGWG